MRVDGKFLAVNGKSNFDGTFTAGTQHDGKVFGGRRFSLFDGNFLAVDQFGTFMSENLPNTSLVFLLVTVLFTSQASIRTYMI